MRALWKCLKYLFLIVLAVELLSFVAMTAHNYILYGNVFSHVPVRYDADTLFMMTDPNPPSRFNSMSSDPRRNRTVWMFGGSTVRGNAHVDENKTLPAFLAKFLNEHAKPRHCSVANLGENGFNSLLESKYLAKMLTQSTSAPQVVIFYDGANDAFQYAEYRDPQGHVGYRRLKAFVESYRRSWGGILKPLNAAIHASYTNELLDRISMFRAPVLQDSPDLEKMVEHGVRRYDYVARTADCYGARFVLIWQPILWAEKCEQAGVKESEKALFVDMNNFPVLRQSIGNTYDALEKALGDRPYFVTLRNALCNRSTGLYWPDGIHLKPEGNELMAATIGELLVKRFPDIFSEVSPNALGTPKDN
jgi:lysophospholipase L1-like esterase